MGGKSRTVVQKTQQNVQNPYDDAWIREKFQGLDERGLEFSDWMASRQSKLGGEADLRSQLQSGLAGLRTDFDRYQGATQANLSNIQQQQQQMGANFQGLSGQQLQQAKDLYNLATTQGSGVYGTQTGQGITYVRPKGTAGMNRQGLQTGSLNI